jgi:acyl carrier protein
MMATTRDEIVAVITEICRPETPDLRDDRRPLLECGLDSLDFASVLMALEDRYKISIGEDELDHLRTLRQIVDHVERHARA